MGRIQKWLISGVWCYVSVAVGIILLAACSLPVDVFAKGRLMLWNFQLSPDGRTVAFSYCDRNDLHCRLGLLDLRNEKIVRIPAPSGKQLTYPSFSYDGKRLAAVMGDAVKRGPSQIVVIDLATLHITQVTEGRETRHYPVFQPRTNNILYVVGGMGVFHHLRLLNISDRTEAIILDERSGFRVGLDTPYFVGPTEIIFAAIAPADPELVTAVINIGRRKTDLITYRLLFGGRPEIILKQVQGNTEKIGGARRPNISNITASESGKIMVFIDLSATEPYQKGVGYNLDLFKMERGRLTQLTNSRSHLAYAHVSYDGSTVAFGSDPTRRSQFDLFILDMKTGKARPTHLRKRLVAHPEFATE